MPDYIHMRPTLLARTSILPPGVRRHMCRLSILRSAVLHWGKWGRLLPSLKYTRISLAWGLLQKLAWKSFGTGAVAAVFVVVVRVDFLSISKPRTVSCAPIIIFKRLKANQHQHHTVVDFSLMIDQTFPRLSQNINVIISIFMVLLLPSQCWCGDASTPAINTANGSGTCNFVCAGDSSQTCGGNNAMSVYKA